MWMSQFFLQGHILSTAEDAHGMYDQSLVKLGVLLCVERCGKMGELMDNDD